MNQRTFVIDTSVLLSDPKAIFKFAEHEVVLPLVVITELEGKRHHPELGYFARQALRLLDDLRQQYGSLHDPIALEKGTLRVELNHIDSTVLPLGFRTADNDARILSVAGNLAKSGHDVCVVSKDLPMRLKASAMGLDAEEYRAEQPQDFGWKGVGHLEISAENMRQLRAKQRLEVADILADAAAVDAVNDEAMLCHQGFIISSSAGAALGRLDAEKQLRLVTGEAEVFGVVGRSAEQRIAIDALLDEQVAMISLGGKAGTGKSALALCAAMEAVLERKEHRKIMVFRPLYPVGGQELGYLPGSESEKMSPWAQAVFDTLESVVNPNVIEEVVARGIIEVLPLTHIRGRSLHDAFVIVDEAQSLEKNVLLTVLSRIGRNSRVVLTHDVAQRDNLRVGRHDGVNAVIETLKGHPLFAHYTLTRPERSPIAALVTQMLEGIDF